MLVASLGWATFDAARKHLSDRIPPVALVVLLMLGQVPVFAIWLGFSVATSVDPDVLLLDEVLSTGDAAFREKSRARIVELMQRARAIVYVTHDLDAAAEFCTRAIELEKGRIVNHGPAAEVVEAYRRRTL